MGKTRESNPGRQVDARSEQGIYLLLRPHTLERGGLLRVYGKGLASEILGGRTAQTPPQDALLS